MKIFFIFYFHFSHILFPPIFVPPYYLKTRNSEVCVGASWGRLDAQRIESPTFSLARKVFGGNPDRIAAGDKLPMRHLNLFRASHFIIEMLGITSYSQMVHALLKVET